MREHIRVADVSHRLSTDLDFRGSNVIILDNLVRRCVSAATDALKRPCTSHSEHSCTLMLHILESMAATHLAIRELIRVTHEKPASVDALALARLQIETLYSVCLMIENESYVERYVKHHWKQLYVRWLLHREECKNLERVREFFETVSPRYLEALKQLAGVSDIEQATVDNEQLDTPLPLPLGTKAQPIPGFPTPRIATRQIGDASRKLMLSRLYLEYQHLCSFAHGSAQSDFFKIVLKEPSPYSHLFHPTQIREMYAKDVAEPAILYSVIGIVECATEILTLCPGDVELRVAASEAWKTLDSASLLGRVLWEIRAKDIVGIL